MLIFSAAYRVATFHVTSAAPSIRWGPPPLAVLHHAGLYEVRGNLCGGIALHLERLHLMGGQYFVDVGVYEKTGPMPTITIGTCTR